MKRDRNAILADALRLMGGLADDWEYSGEITRHTCFFADLAFESLDVVVLCTAIQEHYGQLLPFTDLFAEVGQREHPDISVGEWVDFIYEHLDGESS